MDLYETNLSGADLQEFVETFGFSELTILSGANLSDMDLSGIDLRGINLNRVNVERNKNSNSSFFPLFETAEYDYSALALAFSLGENRILSSSNFYLNYEVQFNFPIWTSNFNSYNDSSYLEDIIQIICKH